MEVRKRRLRRGLSTRWAGAVVVLCAGVTGLYFAQPSRSTLMQLLPWTQRIQLCTTYVEGGVLRCAVLPYHSTTNHWVRLSLAVHPQVAGVSWLERKGASALFASPPESSFDEALRNFMKVRLVYCSYTILLCSLPLLSLPSPPRVKN